MKKQDTRFEVKTVSEYACIEVGTFYEMEDSGIKFAYAAEFANYFPYAPMCYVCKDVATAETVAGKLRALYNQIDAKKAALIAAAKAANPQAEILCFNIPVIKPVMSENMVEFSVKTDEGKDYAVEAYLIEDIADLNGMDAMFAVPAKSLYHLDYNVRKWWIQAAEVMDVTRIIRKGIYFIPEADFPEVCEKADELRIAYNEESRQRIQAALDKRGLQGEIINNSGEWWVNLPDYNVNSKQIYNTVERVLDYIKNFYYEDKN